MTAISRLRIQGAQDGDAGHAKGARTVDQRPPPAGGGHRRMACKGHRQTGRPAPPTSSLTESGIGMSMESCAAMRSAQPPGASLATPTWTPGPSAPSVKLQHRLRSPGLAGRAGRVDAAGAASQPRVQQHALAYLEPFGLGAEGDDLRHHLMARECAGSRRTRPSDCRCRRTFEFAEHQLGLRSAHARKQGPGDDPVGTHQRGVVHLLQAEGQGVESAIQFVAGLVPGVVGIGVGPRIPGLS